MYEEKSYKMYGKHRTFSNLDGENCVDSFEPDIYYYFKDRRYTTVFCEVPLLGEIDLDNDTPNVIAIKNKFHDNREFICSGCPHSENEEYCKSLPRAKSWRTSW